MNIIVGLGNPGKEFENTPHNAGFVTLDLLAAKLAEKGLLVEEWRTVQKEKSMIAEVFAGSTKAAVLVKPLTYMNLSGGAVQQIMGKYGVKNADEVLIVYDELDILLGLFKYSPIHNSRTHRGIASVMATVGTSVHSLRIGVDNRTNKHLSGEAYVVRAFSAAERQRLAAAAENAIAQHILPFLGL